MVQCEEPDVKVEGVQYKYQIVDTCCIVSLILNLNNLAVQDVVNDRIKHCLKHVAGDAEECSVCAGTGKCRLYNS